MKAQTKHFAECVFRCGMKGRQQSRRRMGGWFSLFGSPQRAQRSQRILLVWLCVLGGAIFHKYNITKDICKCLLN